MYLLSEKSLHIKQLLDEQEIISDVSYRPFKYLSIVEEDNGLILLNNLTDECLFLDKNEKNIFLNTKDHTNPTFGFLVNNWFLVPENFDDLTFCENTEKTISLIYRAYRKKPIDSFTIFTTTDCNARCFYCYQHGCEYKTMSKKTAIDVADYILKHKADKELLLRWFGGEPLYNSEAIDIITDVLTEKGVQFKSIMTTNGYLFDNDMVNKAKIKWNLNRVQITLDGTEEIYNKVKAYIYNDVISPYKKVTDNIELLLQNDIIVNVRMNMDKHNVADLFTLTDELLKRYRDYDKFYAYVHLLYDNSCDEVINRDETEEKYLQAECDRLLDVIKQNGKNKQRRYEDISFSTAVYHCMADTDSSIMILPDGKLGKCEHYLEDHFVGSIYEEKIDFDSVNWFKTITTICGDCEDCELRSRCRALKQCHSTKKRCSAYDRTRLKNRVADRMKESYYIKKNNMR